MAALDNVTVTVEKSYFDALLRRADFHTATRFPGRRGPDEVTTISRVEYDSLLRTSRECELLKNALLQGGLTPESLATLISGAVDAPHSKDTINAWSDDFDEAPPSYGQPMGSRYHHESNAATNLDPGYGASYFSNHEQHQASLRAPSAQRQTSYGFAPSSAPDDPGFNDADSFLAEGDAEPGLAAPTGTTLRTLYFCGFPGKTTLRDLLSVIRGGKILNVNMRSSKSATVTFLDAAADYLAWVRKNDIYIHAKRVEVRWAERQYTLNSHVNNKIANGATRNILIRFAERNGLTETRIREDMEHICNFVIVDITFRDGHAYMSSNSVHNALFARTCMMSRRSYKGCKIEFYPDECDVPLPVRTQSIPVATKEPRKQSVTQLNRFDLLNIDDNHSSTDEEDRDYRDSQIGESNDSADTIDTKPRHGVRIGGFNAHGRE